MIGYSDFVAALIKISVVGKKEFNGKSDVAAEPLQKQTTLKKPTVRIDTETGVGAADDFQEYDVYNEYTLDNLENLFKFIGVAEKVEKKK